LVIGGNYDPGVCRNVFYTFVFQTPEDAAEETYKRAQQLKHPLRQNCFRRLGSFGRLVVR
jgi:hypothetical protein